MSHQGSDEPATVAVIRRFASTLVLAVFVTVTRTLHPGRASRHSVFTAKASVGSPVPVPVPVPSPVVAAVSVSTSTVSSGRVIGGSLHRRVAPNRCFQGGGGSIRRDSVGGALCAGSGCGERPFHEVDLEQRRCRVGRHHEGADLRGTELLLDQPAGDPD